MPTSLKSALGSSASLIGSIKLLPESELTRGKIVLELAGGTYLREGFLLVNERANYPDAFDAFARFNTISVTGTNLTPGVGGLGDGVNANGVLLFPSSTGSFVYRSTDLGVSWISVSTPANGYRTVYGNGICLGVNNGGTGINYSTDQGATWTQQVLPPHQSGTSGAFDIAFGNGLFVVTSVSTSAQNVLISSDGINWTPKPLPFAGKFNVAFAGGIFVLTQYAADTRLVTSSDGLTYTTRNLPGSLTISDKARVAELNGCVVVAAGSTSSTMTSTCYYSLDYGVTWTLCQGAVPLGPMGLGSINGVMFMVGYSGPAYAISKDGVNWVNVVQNGFRTYGCIQTPSALYMNYYDGNTSNYRIMKLNGEQFGVLAGNGEVPIGGGIARYMRIK